MIDSHHHLWRYSKEAYPWIPENTPLTQDHLVPELVTATTAAGVSGTVVVQARQTTEESDFLLSLSDQTDVIKGVIGWVPLVDADVGKELTRLAAHPKFKGVRHVLQDEPDAYFIREDFHRGLSKLPLHGLSYDLLIHQRQIRIAMELVDLQPDLPIIIDHIMKPEARNGRLEPDWLDGMRELAKRDNIIGIKFSGLVTEFPIGQGDDETIAAYFEETLKLFGPDRVMFGTDWPVCLLRTTYSKWAETVRKLTEKLSESERKAILSLNTIGCYQINA